MSISISPATINDLPSLAEINRAAYSEELATRFAHKNWRDETWMLSFFSARLSVRLGSPTTQVFKAVDVSSQEVVGFICWTLEQAGGEEITPTAQMIERMPDTMNKEFIISSGTIMEGLREHMRGEEHYYLSSFAVAPKHQGIGIGSQLLKHCVEIADKARLVTWLISFPGSHDLYKRFGFEDVDHRDVDLNAWDGNRLRGYGIYRNWAMRRCCQPV